MNRDNDRDHGHGSGGYPSNEHLERKLIKLDQRVDALEKQPAPCADDPAGLKKITAEINRVAAAAEKIVKKLTPPKPVHSHTTMVITFGFVPRA